MESSQASDVRVMPRELPLLSPSLRNGPAANGPANPTAPPRGRACPLPAGRGRNPPPTCRPAPSPSPHPLVTFPALGSRRAGSSTCWRPTHCPVSSVSLPVTSEMGTGHGACEGSGQNSPWGPWRGPCRSAASPRRLGRERQHLVDRVAKVSASRPISNGHPRSRMCRRRFSTPWPWALLWL